MLLVGLGGCSQEEKVVEPQPQAQREAVLPMQVSASAPAFADGTAPGSTRAWVPPTGYYLYDAFLIGGALAYEDDDVGTVFDASALCRYHFLDAWYYHSNSHPGICSPYFGARLGLVHGKNTRDSATGLALGLQLGLEIFLDQKVAVNVGGDFAMCTADVYPDDYKLKTTDLTLRVGLDFHF